MLRIRYNTEAYCHIRTWGHVTAHPPVLGGVGSFGADPLIRAS